MAVRSKTTTMHEHIKERTGLAHTYAEDGAYSSAARILEELALEVRDHANKIARFENPSARGA